MTFTVILNPETRKLIFEFDEESWKTVEWINAKGQTKIQQLARILFDNQEKTRVRASNVAMAKRIEDLPIEDRRRIENELGGRR